MKNKNYVGVYHNCPFCGSYDLRVTYKEYNSTQANGTIDKNEMFFPQELENPSSELSCLNCGFSINSFSLIKSEYGSYPIGFRITEYDNADFAKAMGKKQVEKEIRERERKEHAYIKLEEIEDRKRMELEIMSRYYPTKFIR